MVSDRRNPFGVGTRLWRVAITVGPILVAVLAWTLWDRVERDRADAAEHRVRELMSSRAASSACLGASASPDEAGRYYNAARAALTGMSSPGLRDELAAARRDLKRSSQARVSRQVAELVAANDLALLLVQRATAEAHKTADLDTRELPTWWSLATLLSLDVVSDVARNDIDGAVASLSAQFSLLRIFNSDHRVLTAAQWVGMIREAVLNLEVVLPHPSVTPGLLAVLDTALREAMEGQELSDIIGCEALNTLRRVAVLTGDNEDDYVPVARTFGAAVQMYVLRPWMRNRAVALTSFASELMRIVDVPYPSRLASIASVSLKSPLAWHPLIPHAEEMLSQYQRTAVRVAEGVALIRSARAAIAALQRERLEGKLTESLDELGALSDLLDPFTGGRLRFIRSDRGFAIYSDGANRVDDGGAMSEFRDGVAVDVGIAVMPVPDTEKPR